MNSSFGRIPQVIKYDLVTHSTGLGNPFGGVTEDLRNTAKSRVESANAGVYSGNPSIPSIMKRSPRSDLEAYFVAAFWLATGAVQSTGGSQTALATLGTNAYEKGEAHWDSWASWLTGGIYTGAEDTSQIQFILSDAASETMRYGADRAQKELKKLILDETNDPAVEPSLPTKVGKKWFETLKDVFVPKVGGLIWIVPVGIGLIALAIILPKVLKRRKR